MAGDTPGPSPDPGSADSPRSGASAVPLALYRRYRPASFAEVKGQEHVTEPLRQALRSGRVHHAYLFSGPRGCGKTSSARILARSLNCESGPTPDPCGICASCVALAPAGPGSIDVIEIDAASHGGVDDARDLRERAFYAPVAARFKIYIIDEAHMVTGGGFNALLKLVEEPPPHLKFVFATTEPEKVIATIRSRTHHYPFRLVPPAVLRELLEQILGSEGVTYEPAVLPVVIRAGAGSVRDSLSILDQLIAGSDESGLSYERAVALLGYTDDALLDDVAEAFAAGDGAAVFGAVDRVVEGGHDPRRFAADLLDRFRDLIVLAAVPDAAASGLIDVPADRLDRMRAQAAKFGPAQLAGAAEIINAGLVEMRGATSPRLLLELMCAQVLLPAPSAEDRALLARLERLERGLGAGGAPAASPDGDRSSRPPVTAAASGPGAVVRRADPAPEAGQGPAGARQPENREARPGDGGTRAGAAPGPTAERSGGTGGSSTGGSGTGGGGTGGGSAGGGGAGGGGADDGGAGGHGTAAAGTGTAGRSAGVADTDSVRAQWAAVLEAVRRERRVAWLLLSNATVDSLAEGILTLRFGKEGEARGFSISGYDRDLGQVLQAMFGVTLQIRAIAGPAQEAAGHRPPQAQARETAGTDVNGAAQRSAAEPDDDDRPARRPADSPQPGPETAAEQGSAGTASGSRSGSGIESARAAAGAARQAAGTGRQAPGRGRQAPGGGAAGHGPDEGFSSHSAAFDVADMTDADALTGIDLVTRELGGQIIEEIGGP